MNIIEETAEAILDGFRADPNRHYSSVEFHNMIAMWGGNATYRHAAAKLLRDRHVPLRATKGRDAEWWLDGGRLDGGPYVKRVVIEVFSQVVTTARSVEGEDVNIDDNLSMAAQMIGKCFGMTIKEVQALLAAP